MRKLPVDAFAYYVSLGDERSYQAVADHFTTSKQAVTKRAVSENWATRLSKIEEAARESLDKRLSETIESMSERHVKMMRIVQSKALQAIANFPLDSGMDGVRALDLSIKHERLVRGEPTERSAVALEDVIKREYQRWMTRDDDMEDEEFCGERGPSSAPACERGDGPSKPPKTEATQNERREDRDGDDDE